MNRLEKRNKSNENLLLEKRFTRTVLNEEGADMRKDVQKKMSGASFQSRELFTDLKIDVTDTVLSYDHLARHRFIDMKRRRTRSGIINKKNYPIHNRILYGYANNIVRRLSFGFTDAVKDQMRKTMD